ncbi:MAG: ribbon-helix-helix domain-containing protein [Leptolyngbyaceae cyanobacterium]
MNSGTVSKRVNLTLPDTVFDELEDWATQQGRPVANLAAFLVETAVRQAKERGEFTPVQPAKGK